MLRGNPAYVAGYEIRPSAVPAYFADDVEWIGSAELWQGGQLHTLLEFGSHRFDTPEAALAYAIVGAKSHLLRLHTGPRRSPAAGPSRAATR